MLESRNASVVSAEPLGEGIPQTKRENRWPAAPATPSGRAPGMRRPDRHSARHGCRVLPVLYRPPWRSVSGAARRRPQEGPSIGEVPVRRPRLQVVAFQLYVVPQHTSDYCC